MACCIRKAVACPSEPVDCFEATRLPGVNGAALALSVPLLAGGGDPLVERGLDWSFSSRSPSKGELDRGPPVRKPARR